MIQARRMDEFEDLKARNLLGRRKKQVQVLEDKRRARNKEHYLEALSITLSYLALSLPYLIHLIFSQKRGGGGVLIRFYHLNLRVLEA